MNSRCAVIIPIYKSDLGVEELFSISNTISKLSNHNIYFVGPQKLSSDMKKLSEKYRKLADFKDFPDRFFASIESYNFLMSSSFFYKQFKQYNYVLIVQTDALVLKDELDTWCEKGYSYIGAPWFEGYTKPVLPLRFMGVGNGGFSLRNVNDFLRVLGRPRFFKNKLMESWPGNWISNSYRYLKDYYSFVFGDFQLNLHVNEDLFWGFFVPSRCSFFKVPAPEEAVAFAFEAYPEYLYELNNSKLPFGCHAWERYGSKFWREVFIKKGIDETELAKLGDLSSN